MKFRPKNRCAAGVALAPLCLYRLSVALVVHAGLLHSALFAQVPMVTFESPVRAGESVGNLEGWRVESGSAEVVGGGGYGGTQGARILPGAGEAHVVRTIPWDAGEATAFIDVRIQPPANAAGSGAVLAVGGAQVAFQRSAEDAGKGEIWVLDGSDVRSAGGLVQGGRLALWSLSAESYDLDDSRTRARDYLRLTIRQDREAGIWDMYVNGRLAAVDLHFEKGGEVPGEIHFFGSETGEVCWDELQVLPENMLFADEDRDGIPDEVEGEMGSDPRVKDRNGIERATGMTYLQRYLSESRGASVAAAGTIPPLSLPPHEPVGALKGDFSVGGEGAAMYAVPVELPKGTAGMEPQLSIVYSSQGGNGLCGMGFNLGGLQKISRGPSSLRKDGVIDGVDFDETDRFFLNGERLVCVAGTYGMDGSEYRTEIDSYARVRLYGNANAGQGSFWRVETKAGLLFEFGASKGSKITCNGAPAPLAWAVNRVSDVCGNYYEVLYAEGASDGPVEGNDPVYRNESIASHRVSKIRYTGNLEAGLPPYVTVDFRYEDRPDRSFGYVCGVRMESAKRLREIEVKTDGEVNYIYRMIYRKSLQTQRSFLVSIAKHVSGGGSLATAFAWDAYLEGEAGTLPAMWSAAGTEPLFKVYETGKNDAKGVISHVSVEEEGRTVHLTGSAWRYYPLPGGYMVTPQTRLSLEFKRPKNPESEVIAVGLDNNLAADGTHLFQLAGKKKSSYHLSHYSYVPAGQSGKVTNPAPDNEWVKVEIPIGTRFTGLHGNLVFINDDDTVEDGVGECWFRGVKLYEAASPETGEIVFPTTNWEVPAWFSSSWEDRGLVMVDLNADGLVDMARNDVVGGKDWKELQMVRESYLNTGEGWTTESDAYLSPAILSSHDGDATDAALAYMRVLAGFSDYNGDGRPDLMKRTIRDGASPDVAVVEFEAMMNDGRGWTACANDRFPFTTHRQGTSSPSSTDRFRDWIETDLNGDGLPDLLLNTKNGGLKTATDPSPNVGPGWSWVYLNRGEGTEGNRWKLHQGYRLPSPEEGSGFSPFLRDGMKEMELGRGLMDLNGDGLPDFYCAGPSFGGSGSCLRTFLNTGNGWTAEIPNARLPEMLVNAAGKPNGVRLVDLNGDGLPDLLRCHSTSDSSYRVLNYGCYLNRGRVDGGGLFRKDLSYGWVPEFPLDVTKSSPANSFGFGNEWLDLNGDGLPDLVFANQAGTAEARRSYLNFGMGFQDSSAYHLPKDTWIGEDLGSMEKSRRSAMFADVNGDGFPDLLAKLKGSSPEVWINQSRPENLVTITDSFGSDLRIEYARLNDPRMQAGWGERVYEPCVTPVPEGQVAVCDARRVVERYSLPDGLGGRRFTSHRYGDLRYDRIHECSLGFGWAEVMDELTRQVTHTEYVQQHPFAGSLLSTFTKVLIRPEDLDEAAAAGSQLYEGTAPGWKKLTAEIARYEQKEPQAGMGGKVYRPFQVYAEKHQYDLQSQNPEAPDLKAKTVTVQALNDYDEFGFLRRSWVGSLDGSGVETRNVYEHRVDGGRWHPGRLKESRITHSKPGWDPVIRKSAFRYRTDGMLEEETIEPGDALSTTKSYAYDRFGNAVEVAVRGSGQARWEKSIYDGRGRFVVREILPLGHEVSHQYDGIRALRTSMTDLHGLTTRFEYDAFGTLVLTRHPDGTATGEATGKVPNPSTLGLPGWGLGNVRYFRAKQSSGEPASYAYFDAAGREILTRTTMLADAGASGTGRYREVYTHRVYDVRGREIGSSLPFARGEMVYYTQRKIDTLNRTYLTIHPNGSMDRVECYGVQMLDGQPVTYSCATSANGQKLERWEDQHGKLVRSRDASGTTTEFVHDGVGRLIRVRLGGELLLENTFDRFGNKVAVWETNSGTSRSAFNAFGEVISSVNAKGQATISHYDELGRPVQISRPEGTYYQEYDLSGGSAAKGKPVRVTGPEGYEERVAYDALGRPVATSKTQFGETFVTSTSYDALGRVATSTDAGGLTTRTIYDEKYSYPVKVVLAASAPGLPVLPGAGTTLWAAGRFDSRGKALTQELAQGVSLEQSYEESTGNLTGLRAVRAQGILQNKSYQWDLAGNLTSRSDHAVGGSGRTFTESFGYDALNRLIRRQVGSAAQGYTYDVKGNLLNKPGASLNYENGKPHQVSRATVKGRVRNYRYDEAGYVTEDGVRSYMWTSFGQVSHLTHGSAPGLRDVAGKAVYDPGQVETRFFFDAAGNRAMQWKTRVSDLNGSCDEELTRYLGSYEREVHQQAASRTAVPVVTKTVHRHVLGDAVYTRVETAGGTTEYRLTTRLEDHLGSTDVLVTGVWSGATQGFGTPRCEYQAYDPWGERADPATGEAWRRSSMDLYVRSGEEEDRGYTGHEMLDDSGLVHMNGRLYDAELGRMLSPDPYVQVPEYSQNFNRYSYVLNNPLNKVDPTGYSWLSKVFHKVGDWLKENWRQVAVIVLGAVLALTGVGVAATGVVLNAVTGTQATAGLALQVATGAVTGSIMGGAQAALNGGSLGDVLRGAMVGAVQGAVSAGPLYAMEGAGSLGGRLVHVAGHGATGGLANIAMGGKFQDGFLSAATGAASVHLGLASLQSEASGAKIGAVGRTVVAAIVGGTASELGGGKFANGAYTAAFQHLLSKSSSSTGTRKESFDSIAAENSEKVYSTKDGGKLLELGLDYQDDVYGFGAALYGDAQSGYQLAFRGTSFFSLQDWKANILQAFGFKTHQFEMAINLAKRVYKATGGNVTFVGHSLGGGLASAAAGATGGNAITFNASGLSGRYYGNPGNIKSYYIKSEILSLVQDLSPLPNAAGIRASFSGRWDPVSRHFIGQFTNR